MAQQIRPGERLPDVELAYLEAGALRTVRPDNIFAGRRAVLIGLPGAFTPLCHGRHLPDFVNAWGQLTASGFDLVAWISPNDPWTQNAWAAQLDPENRLRRFSDGNLEFARAAGLTCRADDLFMGERCQRFSMVLRDAVVERLSVELQYATFSCSRASAVLELG
jgi:peroxiredoxin